MQNQNRYEKTFARLALERRKGFIPYTMLGYPEPEFSFEILEILAANGAAALELGLAFSDPLADGPLIQDAAVKTIESGFKTKQAFEIIRKFRQRNQEIPVTLMAYFNSVLAQGPERFIKDAADSGVDGLLLVDLPPEQSLEISELCRQQALQQIFIISPLTSSERMQVLSGLAGGFLYTVSRLGTTGVEERYDQNLEALIKKAAALTNLPIAVGFGISTPQQAQKMYELGADAVISGSRIIEIIKSVHSGTLDKNAIADYVKSMSEADLKLRA
ncbi:MAG: tryptophan synthase subunit alpha [Candidatus Obscuribacterales bacterium]|nr:tryptophan synthase subunit alpha [Candidatus Obscuribacterales bacterium]